MVLCPERRLSCAHLVQNSAHAPQIGLGVVLFITKDLWRHVEWRAAERFCQAEVWERAGESEISNLEHG